MSAEPSDLPNDGPLSALLSPRPLGLGRYAVDFPDGWQQGRGAFGGVVVGAMVRALEAHVADPGRALRTLTAQLCGPVLSGPAELRVETLRAGSGVGTAACRLVQSGEIQAHAVGVFGRRRATDLDGQHLVAPSLPPWRDREPVPVAPPFGPPFARFFEFRTTGSLPYSGATQLEVKGWVRPKNPGPARDAAYVAVCADAWWSPLHSFSSVPRPLATIDFTLQLCGTLEGLDPNAPLFHRGRDLVVRDGYFVEHRELWGEDGRLVALNQQTFAIIK